MHKKIAYIVSTLRRAGPTSQLLNIISNLDKDVFKPTIITLSPEPADSFKNYFEDLGIHVYSLNLTRLLGLLFGVRKLKKLIRKIQPDIIHSQGIRPDLMVTGISGIPRIATIRNYPFDDNPAKYGNLKGGIMARMHYKGILKGDHVIACSKSLAEKFYNLHQVQLPYIQNGVNTSIYFPVDKTQKEQIRKKLNLPKETFICFTSGGLIPRKKTRNLIDGFLKAKKTNTLLLIAGDGPELNTLNQFTQNFDSVRFLKSITNVYEYLWASDLFVSASISEGLPNSVMEAMACGLPVVLSDIEAHRELIPEGLPYRVFFKPENASELAQLINQFPLEDQEKVSGQIVAYCKANFSAEAMSVKYQELYKEVLHVG